MTAELEAVAAALAAKTDAEAAFRAAIRTARDAGCTLQAIGDAAGMTRAAVMQRLNAEDRTLAPENQPERSSRG